MGMKGDAKVDGSKPQISGGMPICFPQFGPDSPFGFETSTIPLHGFARQMDWTLNKEESTSSRCEMELQDDEGTRKIYPYRFKCKCSVVLENDKLKYKLTISNTGDSPMKFTCGLHTYFHTSDVNTAKVEGGFSGKSKINRINHEQVIYDKDYIEIKEWTDDIYKQVLPGEFRLNDADKPTLVINSANGWKDVVVWNPQGNDEMGYKNFICVENVAADPVELPEGGEWTASLEMSPYSNQSDNKINSNSNSPASRLSGVIKFWNGKQRQGIITPDNGADDIFFAKRSIPQFNESKSDNHKLYKGIKLEYENSTDSEGRMEAINVTGPGGEKIEIIEKIKNDSDMDIENTGKVSKKQNKEKGIIIVNTRRENIIPGEEINSLIKDDIQKNKNNKGKSKKNNDSRKVVFVNNNDNNIDTLTRQTGIIKFWYKVKRQGIITPDNGADEIFFHKRSIINSNKGSFNKNEGKKVQYENSTDSEGRMEAINVLIEDIINNDKNNIIPGVVISGLINEENNKKIKENNRRRSQNSNERDQNISKTNSTASRLSGVIKFWNGTQRQGIITPDNGADDIFFHRRSISGSENKQNYRLYKGIKLEYENSTDSEGRMEAINVTGPEGIQFGQNSNNDLNNKSIENPKKKSSNNKIQKSIINNNGIIVVNSKKMNTESREGNSSSIIDSNNNTKERNRKSNRRSKKSNEPVEVVIVVGNDNDGDYA